ncbi:uncharacterized protein LOC130719814 [Lotus japonicus]|uniref:uncharacterized protein LOC130719814 n=1 Tax=Lotus japonicus TaxID=34305 RepID=UPI0025888AB0|nr:uncharacterized protein LOC130719814 [Lotus japonicus]
MKTWLVTVPPHLNPNSVDAWIWEGSSSGGYSVREGYDWLSNKHRTLILGDDWRWVWKLPVPGKIRVVVWSCHHNALPLDANRFRFHIATSAACTRCSANLEDSIHALRECPHSRELWDVKTWILYHARSNHALKFLVGLWNVWKWRCNMCLDPQPWNLDCAWRKLCHEYDEISSVHQSDGVDDASPGMSIVWRPPHQDLVKLNVDDSYCEDANVMGAGGLIRDHKDCRNLINAIQNRSQGLAQDQVLLVNEIHSLLHLQWQVLLSWVLREMNSAADWLAKASCHDQALGFTMVNLPDPELQVIILKDALGIP